MRPSHALLESSRIATIAVLLVATSSGAGTDEARAGTNVAVPSFRSVEARNGAHVILRHGEKRRVTIVQGNTTETAIRVEEGGRLLIDRCPEGCPKGQRLLVEIVTPEIAALGVTDGGWLRCEGSFPRRADLATAVASGGLLDVRAMNVDAVAAAIQHGGRIFTAPRASLTAAIAHGGAIVYWGNPDVQRSIQHGGVVSRGKPADRYRPIDEIGAAVED